MIRQKIQEEMKLAMKSRDQVRLEAIKFLWSEIRYREIDKKADLTDEEILDVLIRETKKRAEAIEQMKSAGRDALVINEEAKLTVLKEFMPEQISQDELSNIVKEVLATGVSDFGSVMKEVMAKCKGKADGKLVSEVVRQQLGG